MTPMTTVAKRFSAEKTILKISILDFLLWVFMCVQSNHPEDDKNELPPDDDTNNDTEEGSMTAALAEQRLSYR